jgi:hypothetical protein
MHIFRQIGVGIRIIGHSPCSQEWPASEADIFIIPSIQSTGNFIDPDFI